MARGVVRADEPARQPVRFTAGDHLRVWRRVGRLGYYHHGIYLSDERVIQFGGSIRDKPHATVGAVSLAAFERSGTARAVEHGGRTWWGVPRFDALPSHETVRRAEWLAANNPVGLYDLFGYNCEQAANFCSTGSYESYQVRGGFTVSAVVGVGLTLFLAKRQREGRSLSPREKLAFYALIVVRLIAVLLYHLRGERFMKQVGRPWLAHEQSRGGGGETRMSGDGLSV
jgi:hypothetical protein